MTGVQTCALPISIELDNKMAGDNVQAKPNQVAKAEEVTKVVVPPEGF